MKVVIAGATGLIGRHLAAHLVGTGHSVVALSRSHDVVPGAAMVRWDPRDGMPGHAMDGATAIVNLAGEGVGTHRWTATRRASLLSSRTESTRACVRALGAPGPTILVNASAVGYYGATTFEVDETAPPGSDFLATLCVAWEAEAAEVQSNSNTVAMARFGVVLANDGGALPRIVSLARLGANGPIGGGRQWVSWVHIDDAVAAIAHMIAARRGGPCNVVAPTPSRQREFAAAVGRALHRPSFIPVPRFGVTAALGSGPASLVLEGQAVVPRALVESGFVHQFPDLDGALADLLGGSAT